MASPFNALALMLALASATAAHASDQAAIYSDQQLKDRIVFRLETDVAVKKYDVDVDVAGGVARLNGDVATVAQKTEAGRLAQIPGISQVKNDIKIDKDADARLALRAKQGLTKSGEKLTDARISAKVRWLFDQEELLKTGDIQLETSDRVVTVAGVVSSPSAKQRAVQLAKAAEGVVQVVDQLMIR